ncbi:hypothetical protein KSF_088590 [Reticulibacter mediterranei]|uniref:Uncharacterized protein n=1 Tax=Reticulibacter mediterranei TaxID=2778369 RepID=A0A8J3J0Y2_9CHLR|nr:hypothetical protein [Reticulibacter mediterranei]GHO98811.1 hypothetical protein KSF_088590 [Reticulibacter mediterranei]
MRWQRQELTERKPHQAQEHSVRERIEALRDILSETGGVPSASRKDLKQAQLPDREPHHVMTNQAQHLSANE